MEELPILIMVGLALIIVITFGNYKLYRSVFFDKHITNKAWFRGLMVLLIYIPGLNIIGLLILLYMRGMKALDINIRKI